MNRAALVLAAHGSRHEPAVNDQIRELAAEAAAHGLFAEVAVTFHQGEPVFSEVLDGLQTDEVTVVPVMTSAGYYSDTVLPRELARNRRFQEFTLRITPPLGMHARLPDLVAARVRTLMVQHGLAISDTTIAVIGHGTPRHPRSRLATQSLADRLLELGTCDESMAFFLDDQPPVELLMGRAARHNVIVVPFLIGVGPHATKDIPRRIGMTDVPAEMQIVNGRFVVYDIPVGAYPQMIDLLLDLALGNTLPAGPVDSTVSSQAEAIRS